MKKHRIMRSSILMTLVCSVTVTLFVAPTKVSPASALSGSDFNPGNIVSDALFYNGNAMSAAEVQSFLNQQVPTCLIGQPGKRPGDPFIYKGIVTSQKVANACLKDFRTNTYTVSPNANCTQYVGAANESAATIITKVGEACGVSQKVLLVTMQKEQSLVSDTWPTDYMYDRAMGHGCPDSGPNYSANCNGALEFFAQVYNSAWQFKNYKTAAHSFKYKAFQYNSIQWNPNPACGASTVYIENHATAALYNYTPYRPNTAALNNLHGSGDGCSAYGNRNFWRIYNQWFGSTSELPGSRDYITSVYYDVLDRGPESEAVLNYWMGRMASGMSRVEMANAFNNSDEYRIIKINEAYQKALRRAPEPNGLNYWLGALQRGQLSPENLYSTFIHMDEMYYSQGGGTNGGYITAMYRELLLREPDAEGLAYWTRRLDRGEPRSAISNSIWFSPEKYNVRVQEAYTEFLGRQPGAAETEYWSNIARVYGPTQMRSMIIASDEYWTRANNKY